MTTQRLLCGLMIVALLSVSCAKSKNKPSLSTAPPTTSASTPAPEPESSTANESAVATGQVAVTKVEKIGDAYTIVLNNVLEIPKVQIREGQNGEFLSFPQRSADGKFWSYIRVNRGDEATLLTQVKAGTPAANTPQGFTVSKTTVKMLESTGKRKAFVEFELNGGAVTLYSWVLIEGSKGPFLAPPSEKSGNDWVDVLSASSSAFRKALESAALVEYKAQGGVVPANAGN